MVIMPVAAPVIRLVAFEKPDFFARFMAKVVAREDAERLTMLFPIKMELSIFVWLLISFKTNAAFLLPSSAIDFKRILFTVVRHVSAEEKNAENNNSINKINSFEASLESK